MTTNKPCPVCDKNPCEIAIHAAIYQQQSDGIDHWFDQDEEDYRSEKRAMIEIVAKFVLLVLLAWAIAMFAGGFYE